MGKPLAYRGSDPYVFVCYAHEDAEAVYPEIAWLQAQGINVWYDEGIGLGTEWTEALADAIQRCDKFLFFVTPKSVEREHCRRELNFAQGEGRDVLVVHLRATEVSGGLRLSLYNRQAIFKHEISDNQYQQELVQAIAGTSDTPTSSVTEPPSHSTRLLVYAVAALLIAVAGAWWFTLEENRTAIEDEALEVQPVAATPTDVLHNSIAVLPFDNLSPNPDNAYFAAGIHEEVLNQLAKIRDLAVIARTSVSGYAESPKPIPEIARELRVGAVMEGSVRYAGGKVRITAQLIDGETGAHLWSESYDRDFEDIFAIQSDIALHITQSMRVQFSQAEQAAIAAVPTENLEAYTHYIKATKDLMAMDFDSTASELDEAIRLDPEFALAIATKAYLHGARIYFGSPNGNNPARARQNAQQASALAEQAIALDPNQALAYTALADVNIFERRWDQSVKNITKAYRLSPNSAPVASAYGHMLLDTGRDDEALQVLNHAMALDPGSTIVPEAAAAWAFNGGQYELVELWAKKIIAMSQENPWGYIRLAQVAAFSGKRSVAEAMLRESQAKIDAMQYTGSVRSLIRPLEIHQLLGNASEVEQLSPQLIQRLTSEALDPDTQFYAYSALRDADSAVGVLSRIVEDNFPTGNVRGLHYSHDSAYFDAVRQHPDFAELVRRVAIPIDSPI